MAAENMPRITEMNEHLEASRRSRSTRSIPLPHRTFRVGTSLDRELGAAAAAACASNPLRDVDHSASDSPLRISDIAGAREYRRGAFFAEAMRPRGLEHDVKLWLPAPKGTSRCFELERAPGRDFDRRDIELLRLLRPHLARLRAAWGRARRIDLLTERERDVLALVAEGLTNRQIAQRLFIAASTVRTHLEHVYDKLGVRTRAGAVAAAFQRPA